MAEFLCEMLSQLRSVQNGDPDEIAVRRAAAVLQVNGVKVVDGSNNSHVFK